MVVVKSSNVQERPQRASSLSFTSRRYLPEAVLRKHKDWFESAPRFSVSNGKIVEESSSRKADIKRAKLGKTSRKSRQIVCR
ncbi:hypothetical protein NPIL_347441 [Nephila pilipes]|uniref:Uncharacterized protein n=1 Tax=Nephila pilipes TaxID=299642 RepID=A0A8X6TX15_NEPPI|nr:hypothetical protein NPIL_347441 [Nephila pilipes]